MMAREAKTANGQPFFWFDKVFSIELRVPVDDEKKVTVEYENKRLKITIEGQPPIIDEALYSDVRDSGMTWFCRDGLVTVTMKKAEDYEFWPKLFDTEGSKEIKV